MIRVMILFCSELIVWLLRTGDNDHYHDVFYETPYADADSQGIIATVCLLMQGDASAPENRPTCLDLNTHRNLPRNHLS